MFVTKFSTLVVMLVVVGNALLLVSAVDSRKTAGPHTDTDPNQIGSEPSGTTTVEPPNPHPTEEEESVFWTILWYIFYLLVIVGIGYAVYTYKDLILGYFGQSTTQVSQVTAGGPGTDRNQLSGTESNPPQ